MFLYFETLYKNNCIHSFLKYTMRNTGASVLKLVKEMCTSKEQGKYENFVREVDNIVKLLISLCGRITRVDKSMLQCQQDSQENVCFFLVCKTFILYKIKHKLSYLITYK